MEGLVFVLVPGVGDGGLEGDGIGVGCSCVVDLHVDGFGAVVRPLILNIDGRLVLLVFQLMECH
jgi:hypothetical protein